jgi:tetratricopeptide (TPR) repeat protein
MTIDVYAFCPGGTNKKIKFCQCGKDMLGDLNKIITAIDGGQTVAASGHINRQIESHGPRPCLLAIKSNLQLQMGNMEELEKVTATFNELYPENPIALSLAAIRAAGQHDVDEALDRMQDAFEFLGDAPLNDTTYAAITIMSPLLLNHELVVPAVGYLTLQAAIGPEEDESAFDTLRAIFGSPGVPCLLKYSPAPIDRPEGAPWVNALEQCENLAARGRWRKAVAMLKDLDQQYPDQPTILQNLARYQGWLNQLPEAAATWRRLTKHPSLDLEYAVEIEAMAQLMSEDNEQMVDEILRVYPVDDSQRMMERLLSEKQVMPIPSEQVKPSEEGSPPPKGAFWLLDRVQPPSGKELQLHEIPNVLGEMYLYGRETDRQARLEFVTVKSADYDRKLEVLTQFVEQHCGEPLQEEPIGQVPAQAAAMTWRWRLPDDTPRVKREELIDEKRREINLNVWPETPQACLDGKRPIDVAGDENYRIPLLAAILLLEDSSERNRIGFDYNELRAKLNLPLRHEFSLAEHPSKTFSPMQLHLVRVDDLTNQQLLELFEVAFAYRLSTAGMRLGRELLARPSLISRAERPRVLDLMSRLSNSAEEILEFVHIASDDALATGQSLAPWLLRELEIRLMMGNSQRANELLTELQSKYIRDPKVAQALYSLLVRFGIISPDGQPRQPGAGVPSQPSSGQSQAAAASPGVWTPDGPQAPAGGGEKPKLWVPGMD